MHDDKYEYAPGKPMDPEAGSGIPVLAPSTYLDPCQVDTLNRGLCLV